MILTGIYKITSSSNRVYIGQSWDIDQRVVYYRNNLCKGQRKLYASLKKYGWIKHKFEICCELPNDVTQEVLDDYEIFYWQQYKDLGFDMLNLKFPGSGGKHSEESKAIMKKKREESIYKASDITRQRMSLAGKGKKFTEEHKRKMSESAKNWLKTNKHSCLGRKFVMSEEQKISMSKSKKGKKVPNSYKDTSVYTFVHQEFGEEICTIQELYLKYSLRPSNIYRIVKFLNYSAKGWKLKPLIPRIL